MALADRIADLAAAVRDRLNDKADRSELNALAARLAALEAGTSTPPEPAPEALPRVFISTDLRSSSAEQDDAQSLLHALLCQDKFEIVGISATASKHGHQNGLVADVREIIDVYGLDEAILRVGDSRFKTAADLKAMSWQGTLATAPEAGWSNPTPASAAIMAAAKDARDAGAKLNVLTWGGEGDIAQALHDDPAIAPHIRFFSISNQDVNAHAYITATFKGALAMWVDNMSTFRGTYQTPEANNPIQGWHEVNAAYHGYMGQEFAARCLRSFNKVGVKMGDSPTVLRFLNGNQDDPTQPSWGGRFRRPDPVSFPNYYTDLTDNRLGGRGDTNGAYTVYEHRDAWLADFASRFDLIKRPASAPDKIMEVGAVQSGTGATIAWTAPGENWSPISDYLIRINGTVLNDGVGTTTNFVWTDAPLGNHDVEVAAVNGAGTGPWSDPRSLAITEVAPGNPDADPDPLRHVWPLREGAGGTATSANGLVMTSNTAPEWRAGPQRITMTQPTVGMIPANAALNTDDIAFGMVLRIIAHSAGAKMLFGRDQPTAGNRNWQIMYINNGELGITAFPPTGNNTHTRVPGVFSAGEWLMVSGILGATETTFRKNGAVIGVIPHVARRRVAGDTSPITIGGRYATSGGGWAEFMNGDDIAVFGIRESAVAADVAALEARLRQIATSKGITLPGTE